MMIKYQMCVLTTFKDEIYKRLNAFQSGTLRSKEAVNLYSPLSDLGFHSIPWRCENSEVGRSTSRPQSRTKQTVMMSRQLQGLSGGRQLWCFLQSVSDRLPLVAIWLYAYLKKKQCCWAPMLFCSFVNNYANICGKCLNLFQIFEVPAGLWM